jgi:hypothetical protein
MKREKKKDKEGKQAVDESSVQKEGGETCHSSIQLLHKRKLRKPYRSHKAGSTDKLKLPQKDNKIVPKEYVKDTSESSFSFKNFYINYARFHNNKMNILIHIIGIPMILFSLFGLIDIY